MKRITIISVFLALLIAISFFGGRYLFITVGWDGLTTRVERQYWREMVRRTISDLQLGLSKNQVEQIVKNHNWQNYCMHSESEIKLGTPIEFGARNWIVYLAFENDLLTEIKIRTEDSIFRHPKDAPPDIVYLRDSEQ